MLGGILTRKEMPLKLKGKVYVASVRSVVVRSSETWPIKLEQTRQLKKAEMEW